MEDNIKQTLDYLRQVIDPRIPHGRMSPEMRQTYLKQLEAIISHLLSRLSEENNLKFCSRENSKEPDDLIIIRLVIESLIHLDPVPWEYLIALLTYYPFQFGYNIFCLPLTLYPALSKYTTFSFALLIENISYGLDLYANKAKSKSSSDITNNAENSYNKFTQLVKELTAMKDNSSHPSRTSIVAPRFCQEKELTLIYYSQPLQTKIKLHLEQIPSLQNEQKLAIQSALQVVLQQLFSCLFDQGLLGDTSDLNVENPALTIVSLVRRCLYLNPIPWQKLISLLINYPVSPESNIFREKLVLEGERCTAAYFLTQYAIEAFQSSIENSKADFIAKALKHYQRLAEIITLRRCGLDVQAYDNLTLNQSNNDFSLHQDSFTANEANETQIIDLVSLPPTNATLQTPETPGSEEQMLAQHNDVDSFFFGEHAILGSQSLGDPYNLKPTDKLPTPNQRDTSPDMFAEIPEDCFAGLSTQTPEALHLGQQTLTSHTTDMQDTNIDINAFFLDQNAMRDNQLLWNLHDLQSIDKLPTPNQRDTSPDMFADTPKDFENFLTDSSTQAPGETDLQQQTLTSHTLSM
jgi:hypothetical protein